MKNGSSLIVELGRKDRSSTSAPDNTSFRLTRKFALAAASALICWAAFDFSQSAKAEETFVVAGINSTLPAWSTADGSEQSSQPKQQIADDSAISALTSFAQQIGAQAPKPVVATTADSKFNDQVYSELRAFAQRIGAGQPASIKDQPKLAASDTLFDWLSGKNSSEAPAAMAPKGPAAKGMKKTSAPVEAHYVGSKACATCHSAQIAEFQKTLMGKIGMTQKGKFECENCHGPGSAHVKAGGGRGVGGIMSFEADDPRSVEERNGLCLACHERGARTLWAGSTHETRGLACTNCHTIMKAVSRKHQLKTASQPDTCFQCHKDIRAKFARSEHMPLPEGKMVCTDCHSPHGSYNDHLLKKATVNEVCFQCHAEKRGPFLWEHPPVVESCLNCHDPHGSINENLLVVSRPRLCQRCHNAATRHPANPRNPLQIQAMNGGCVNCHSQIHGSNNPGGIRFLR